MSKRSESQHRNALAKQAKNYRKSGCGKYWILDVEKRDGEKCEIKLLEHHLAICQEHIWCIDKCYAVTNIPVIDPSTSVKTQKLLYMHTLISEPPAGKEVDHRNHNKTDNRYDINNKNISNLQNKYQFQNFQNKLSAKNSSSIFVGVSKHKLTNKWRASIRLKKLIHLGLYSSEEHAALAYAHAAISANELTAHLPEDRQNMFILNGANLELNTAMRFGMVSNLPQDKLDYIKDKVSANLKNI